MHSRVKQILSGMKETCKGTGKVFSLVNPRCWFEPAVKAAKLEDFSWHCLRHTFISRLVMAGVDLRTVQELAGHKNIAMTCRYAHLAPSHQQAALEKLVVVRKRKSASATTTATSHLRETNAASTTLQ